MYKRIADVEMEGDWHFCKCIICGYRTEVSLYNDDEDEMREHLKLAHGTKETI
jgi:hypothetical protein